jgi:hypothetical protein
MNWEDHGGSCCGVTHIVNFGDVATKRVAINQIRSTISDHQEEYSEEDYDDEGEPYENNYRKRAHLYEATLIDVQLTANDNRWAKALKEVGFKPVSRFLNSNSGNVVTVFHLNYGQTFTPPLPFSWEKLGEET